MNWSEDPRAVFTTAPDGSLHTGETILNPAICCVLWHRVKSQHHWRPCSGFIAYSQVRYHRADLAIDGITDCLLTPARANP